MKRIIKSFLTLFLGLIILSSCSRVKLEDAEVIPPQSVGFNLSPYWKFSKAYSLSKKEEIKNDPYLEDQNAVLDREIVLIGNDRIKNPNIKAQRVKVYEYFISKYKISPDNLNIKEDTIDIYSVTDAKGYSIRILKISDDKIAIEENNILVYFDKVDSLPGINLSLLKSNSGQPNQNGVLLGLKSKRTSIEGKMGESKYRTLWIKYNQDKKLEVYEIENIIFPRNNFYLLSVDREENIDVVKETISIKNLNDGTIKKEAFDDTGKSRFTDITFISPDYISQVLRVSENKAPGVFQTYATKNISKINVDMKTSLSDLFGLEGLEIYRESAKNELIKEQKYELFKNSIDESSFILKRRNGTWIYEGRINNKDNNDIENFIDFRMNFRDNFRVFKFDTLVPSWSRIKVMNPNAEDAVSSPNNFFSVVMTKDAINIYPKDDKGNINTSTIAKIDLINGEEIIMHEWAVDSYVDEWDKVVKKYGKAIIN